MKPMVLAAISTIIFSSYADAGKVYKERPVPTYKKNYLSMGGGGAFPMKNSQIEDSSITNIFGPTGAPGGVSYFELPNVIWENNYRNGYEANIAFGHRFTENWRGETEFVYQNMKREIDGSFGWRESSFPSRDFFASTLNNPIAKAESTVNVYSLLANVIYDHTNSTKWTPFIGGGVGVVFMNSSGTTKNGELFIETTAPILDESAPTIERSPSLNGTAFAWQFKTGINYDISEAVSVLLQYRLLGTTDFNASSSTIITNPDSSTGDFIIPAHNNVDGLLVNGIDLNIRFNV